MVKQIILGIKLLGKAAPILSGLKAALFSDGKFVWKRALILLAFSLVVLAVGQLSGWDPVAMESFTDALDEISDSIGYEN